MPQELYEQCRNTIINRWYYGYKNLGFVRNLALERLRAPFVMPLFGRTDMLHIFPDREDMADFMPLTCGLSRFVANLVAGVGANEIPLILLSDQPPTYPGWQELSSTDQFTNLFQLADIDYEISLNMNKNAPAVTTSILKHSVYDYPDQVAQHAGTNESVVRFWEKFTTDGKINITIFCTEETRSFIQESPLFNIKYLRQRPDAWEFSFGKILGAYNPRKLAPTWPPDLYLWLYDITEPVYLCLLLPWATGDNGVYYSNNKKSVLINTSHRSSIEIIGDWVK